MVTSRTSGADVVAARDDSIEYPPGVRRTDRSVTRYRRTPGPDEAVPMIAYLIADTNVHDAENYERYKSLARPIAEQFGGEYLARGGELRVDDDDLWSPSRLVVIAFPDMAAVDAFLDSEEYAPVKEMRRRVRRLDRRGRRRCSARSGVAGEATARGDRRIEVQRAIAADPVRSSTCSGGRTGMWRSMPRAC